MPPQPSFWRWLRCRIPTRSHHQNEIPGRASGAIPEVPVGDARFALSHPLRSVVGEMTTGAAATELSGLTEAIDGLELSVDAT